MNNHDGALQAGEHLHEEEDHLAGDVSADAIHIHVAPPRHPAHPSNCQESAYSQVKQVHV
jgi:hypothetical protein